MEWLKLPIARTSAALILGLIVLFAADALCYRITLPIAIDYANGNGTLNVGGQVIQLGPISRPIALQFPERNPFVHEYQIDGTDSTNNFTLDTSYLATIANSPYYRFQAWMRDLNGTSTWRDVAVSSNGTPYMNIPNPVQATNYTLPVANALHITLQLQRPETPMTLILYTVDQSIIQITLDRNNRSIAVQIGSQQATHTFFPTDVAPFAAMVVDFLVRVMLWAMIVLILVLFIDVGIAVVASTWPSPVQSFERVVTSAYHHSAAFFSGLRPPSPIKDQLENVSPHAHAEETEQAKPGGTLLSQIAALLTRTLNGFRRAFAEGTQALFAAIHPVGFIVLLMSFGYVIWIALVEYHQLPHIYDASAYLFGAKIIASGQFSVPAPPALNFFPGPFMVVHDGRWFTQYEPGTSLVLALGLKFGVPWLVEPLLGALALVGIGLIAARLYDRKTATLAVILGALSPFYSYLAASYLSHAIALFFLVYGFWLIVRFAYGAAGWNLPLGAALLGIGALTRDLIAVLFGIIIIVGVLALFWRSIAQNWQRWLVPAISFLAVVLVFVLLYRMYNTLLTGSPSVTPRNLFFAGDRWGFGQGIGFYGQHTLAAGFITVDELIASLAINLYGWPFYLTLAFLALPFLTLRARAADWLMLAGAVIMTGAFIGYYYHGIYLGPRYLFEALPFFLILTARGIVTLAQTGRSVATSLLSKITPAQKIGTIPNLAAMSIGTILIVLLLVLCNLLYFTPRQIALHNNFTGFPAGSLVNTQQLLNPPLHHAIVVTDNYMLYGYTLFALNDPSLSGNVIYAFASSSADFAELNRAFPGRPIYQLTIQQNGTVSYLLVPLGGSAP